jgi:uncharacterized protein (TIGR03663 family)
MQATKTAAYEEKSSWLDRPALSAFTLSWETLLFLAIISLVIITRFYDLESRVMSHDETSHVYFSWRLYRGEGYQHDPITHGPLQFHLIALSYFLFGPSDFSARIPVVLANILTVAFLWNYRRYLGRAGTLAAAFLFLISPYLLYYSRYVRNESLVALFGVVMLWAILRYLETGTPRYLYWLTAATILHFAAKETAFIYTAQALFFLGLFFLFRISQREWLNAENRNRFLIALVIALLLLSVAGGLLLTDQEMAQVSPTETAAPAVPGQEEPAQETPFTLSSPLIVTGIAGLALLAALYFLIRGYSLARLRTERSFDLLILLGTLVLPMLAPLPIKLIGWNPLDYSSEGILRTSAILLLLALISVAVGFWWNRRQWLINAAIFYAIFTIFYTTIFTNGIGFITGLVGSLGYWIDQHAVERGSQPWYYYLFVQIPVYEFLAALGSLLAVYIGLRWLPRRVPEGETESEYSTDFNGALELEPHPIRSARLFLALISFWIITSLFAYSYAGEKMPWLTVHIALPMLLLAGWGLGRLIEAVHWRDFRFQRGYLVVPLMVVFIISLIATVSIFFGVNPPFQGDQLEQLRATTGFLAALVVAIGSGYLLSQLLRTWSYAETGRVLLLIIFAGLALITARSAFRATYINYDYPIEYLVYAHSGPGSKIILSQVEEISRRTTDGLALQLAYDNQSTYPFWWYFRDYPNLRYFASNPTRDLREVQVIVVGEENYGKIEPVVGQAFHKFEYVRMWWPNQDYFNLTWERIWNAISNPEWRSAVFQIWLNRDYSQYAALTNRDMSLPNWQPAARMRMYVRKDLAASLWNYGVGPAPDELVADPYEGKETQQSADITLGGPGLEPGRFQRPRGIAVAPDGSLYVADTENHRIQHLAPDGSILGAWGSFSGNDPALAVEGSFNEPWGISVGPEGHVYVADTWNHRIQKFNAQGEFVMQWGFFGQAETPIAFWGPRDVLVDQQGRVLVSDTGNKRIVVFDAQGNYLSQFGSQGFGPGQFDEPVGLASDSQGNLYVADTWNQRIQVFTPDAAGNYNPLTSWEVYAWFGGSLDNKPYLAVDENDLIYATDPEGYRVLVFTPQGEIVHFWGDYSLGPDGFGMAGAVAADGQGGVWVSDVGNSRLMRFVMP